MWLDGMWAELALVIEGEVPTKWNKHCPHAPGVYRLIALSDVDARTPDILQRLCGHDVSGTLYIGSSKDIHKRISGLIRTVDPGYQAQHYPELPDVLRARFPVERQAVSWQPTKTVEEARTREAELLRRYVVEFGERPPRNGQGGIR